VLPYNYKYYCKHSLTIVFIVKIQEFAHLLFGTIDKDLPNASSYIGLLAYNKKSFLWLTGYCVLTLVQLVPPMPPSIIPKNTVQVQIP